MAVYAYKGIDARGKNVKGVLDADSPKALRVLLKKDGVLATEVLEQSEARKKSAKEIDFGRFFKRVTATDMALVTRQLSVLLRSGIPLVEALSALIEQQEKEDLAAALTDTRDKVSEGKSLSDALGAHPKLFDTLYVNMVSAGEASGTLENVLASLAEFLDDQAKLKSKVTGALAYPAFMALLGIGVVILMMTVVVPKVTAIFESFDKGLPWYTQLLIWFSNFIGSWWWLIILVSVGSFFGFKRWRNTEAGRAKWDTWMLKLPLFGTLFVMVAVARMTRTLSTLLSSGVPVLRALEITRNVLANTQLKAVVEDARVSLMEGKGLAKPLKASGQFPPIVTHMIAIGERSGQLEEMLEHVAIAYDQQVEVRVTAMTALLEPLIIVLMGGMVGGIAFSILMPLMQINEFVQ